VHVPSLRNRGQVIAIGSSTGGVEAVRQILSQLPDNLPPIVITQHMPPSFMDSFAERLDKMCRMSVCIAEERGALKPGHAYIAPGDRHLTFRRQGEEVLCSVDTQGKVSGHCPSVDVMFGSIAEIVAEKALGVILTGMGADGAEGMLRMRNSGARTLGQDEASCVVYGMPKKAFECGAVERQVPLALMAREIVASCQ
jgi:two-component system chemotaxis response regulator CheB